MREVRDPSRDTWRIGRRWAPWRRRVRMPRGLFESDRDERPEGLGDPFREPNEIDAAVGAAALLPVAVRAVGIGAETVAQGVALPFVLLARAVGLAGWPVSVVHGRFPVTEVAGGSWADSAQRIDEVAEQINRGDLPRRTIDLPPFV